MTFYITCNHAVVMYFLSKFLILTTVDCNKAIIKQQAL